MSGETAQLQRLTDDQVSARLVAYNADGSLERDLKLFKEHILGIVVAEIGDQFGAERADRYAAISSSKIDANWIQSIAEYGRQIYCEHTSVPTYIADRFESANRVFGALKDQFGSEAEQLANCIAAYYRLDLVETDIILAQVALLEAIDPADTRGRESEQFERRVAELFHASTDQ